MVQSLLSSSLYPPTFCKLPNWHITLLIIHRFIFHEPAKKIYARSSGTVDFQFFYSFVISCTLQYQIMFLCDLNLFHFVLWISFLRMNHAILSYCNHFHLNSCRRKSLENPDGRTFNTRGYVTGSNSCHNILYAIFDSIRVRRWETSITNLFPTKFFNIQEF